MSNEKTIRMPKKLLKRWLKALRGGTYTQATGTLYEPESCGFCCLGVLQHAVSGGYVETYENGDWQAFPSLGWRQKNGVEFYNDCGDDTCDPWIPSMEMTAADLNDGGHTFAEIADAIEACAEGV
jgi:hypothetical protein